MHTTALCKRALVAMLHAYLIQHVCQEFRKEPAIFASCLTSHRLKIKHLILIHVDLRLLSFHINLFAGFFVWGSVFHKPRKYVVSTDAEIMTASVATW